MSSKLETLISAIKNRKGQRTGFQLDKQYTEAAVGGAPSFINSFERLGGADGRISRIIGSADAYEIPDGYGTSYESIRLQSKTIKNMFDTLSGKNIESIFYANSDFVALSQELEKLDDSINDFKHLMDENNVLNADIGLTSGLPGERKPLLGYVRVAKEDINGIVKYLNKLEDLQIQIANREAEIAKEFIANSDGFVKNSALNKKAADEARQRAIQNFQEVNDALANVVAKTVTSSFREQCFIQRNIYNLVLNRVKYLDAETKLPYEVGLTDGRNHPINVDGSPFGFMNLLTLPRSTRALFTLSNAVLSQLQPYIRLYKVDENNFETPIEFDSSSKNLASAMRNSKKRGSGVGLKSFNFAYEGTDPFSVKKSISAKLDIFAASFSELLEPRTSTGDYTYADLALKTSSELTSQKIRSGINSTGVIDNLNKLKFRLKAVVGYSMPDNLYIPPSDLVYYKHDDVKKAIYNSFVTLNLTPTIHHFKFDESGRVTFTINYLAYQEDFFDLSYFNIFSDLRISPRVYKRKILRKWYESTCANKQIDILNKQEEKLTPKDRRNAFRSLIERLIENEKIFIMEIPYAAMKDFVIDPLATSTGLIKTSPASKSKAKSEAKEALNPKTSEKTKEVSPKFSTSTNSNKNEQISFFYFHDLIDVAMRNVEDSLSENGYIKVLEEMNTPDAAFINAEKKILQKMRENYQQLRVVLGPIEIRNPENSTKYMNASIGDIPVSLKYFAEWMTEKVVARERLEYSLSRFINDFVKQYLRNFLNDSSCYGSNSKQRVVFQSSNITSYANPGEDSDELSMLIKADRKKFSYEDLGRLYLFNENPAVRIRGESILNTMGKRDLPNAQDFFNRQFNYMIFYAGRTAPKGNDSLVYRGIKNIDEDHGIFHYILGRDRGIVKSIDLTRTDAPGLKELRFEQEGYDGLFQLREVYDVNIKTFSFPNAFPGTYIFVDPRGFDPQSKAFGDSTASNLTNLGIGGYFMITKSEHNFREGEASTSITAKWVSETNQDQDDENASKNDKKADINSNISAVRKCQTKSARVTPSNYPTTKASTGGKDTVTQPPE